MKKALMICLVFCGLFACREANVNKERVESKSVSLLSFLSNKMEYTAETVLNRSTDLYPSYTSEKGVWHSKKPSVWTSGFLPGIYWYLYALTDEEKQLEYARLWTENLESLATATDNDTGFQIFNSFGLGYEFTGQSNADYRSTLLTAADTLVKQRYNQTIGAFRAWKQSISNPNTMPFEVNVDMIMNMELVLWAGQNGGSPEYVDYAVHHADATWNDIIREDASSYHVASYKKDGTVLLKRTHQGWKRDSTWSRGQSWAVYGYAMFYRYTGMERMLERSIECFDYYVEATESQSSDFIPFADFDAPLNRKNPRDSSAAAVVASAALELYKITGEERFLDYSENVLNSLLSESYFPRSTDYQSLLTAASEKWGRPEVGAIFGDYYLMESLYRWQKWSGKQDLLETTINSY